MRVLVLLAAAAAFLLEVPTPERLQSGRLMAEAHAVIGAPATPGSVAGAKRRTRRRTAAVVGSSAYAAGQASATPAPAAPPPPSKGTAVQALPGGCGKLENGVYNCGGVIYKPFFQGDEVIYVVQ